MFVVFTDTDCNITPELAKSLGYELIYMPYAIEGVEHMPYEEGVDFDYKDFYSKLREGKIPTTSALNPFVYREYFEKYFKEGTDILYIHFSKKMSGTFNALQIAIDELKQEYPNVRFEMFDTKAIACGSLAILMEAGDLIKAGKSMDEVLAWLNENVYHYASYFVIEDLDFMRRSGRTSNFAASVGSLIGLRPITQMAEDGSLQVCAKALGKKKAMAQIMAYVDKLQDHIKDHVVVLLHSDSYDQLMELKQMIVDKYGECNFYIDSVNPTIGAHCGPSTIGITFHSTGR